jgi:hypothetical protein
MMPGQETQARQAWHEIVCDTLKHNSIQLVTYVPDNVLKPLIKAVHEDSYFKAFATTREEEAVGIVSGAWMAGMRGIVLMQTVRLRDAGQRHSLAARGVPDSRADDGVGTRRARRIQSRSGDGGAHHAAGALLAGDGEPHDHAAG